MITPEYVQMMARYRSEERRVGKGVQSRVDPGGRREHKQNTEQ